MLNRPNTKRISPLPIYSPLLQNSISLFPILSANSQQRFLRKGCPNCEPVLDLTNHGDSVSECTSQVFEGLITLADPSQSWVAKWQRLDKYVGGVYAVKVVGVVSDFLGEGEMN